MAELEPYEAPPEFDAPGDAMPPGKLPPPVAGYRNTLPPQARMMLDNIGQATAIGHNSAAVGEGSVAVGGMGQSYDQYNTPVEDADGKPVLVGALTLIQSGLRWRGSRARTCPTRWRWPMAAS